MTGAPKSAAVPQPRLDPTVPECPYVGLVPFGESDAPYFFGRQRECEVVVANLTAARLTLFYAESGVGKSSVLQAGVLPRLQRLAEESYADFGVPDAAVAYVREWSLDPLDTIATAVLHAVSQVPGAGPAEMPGPPQLRVPWLRAVLQRSRVAAIYLVLDQFEEYFLYHPDDRGEDGLAGALGRILSTHDLPVNVLVSIREDALAALDRFKGRVPRLYDNYLRLAHLGRHAAQEAIEGPLNHYNPVVPPDFAVTVEPELTVALLDQVRTGHLVVAPVGAASNGVAQGREDVETPYLQLVLTRLWEAERASGSSVLRRSTLDELGGAQTIVQTHLHTVMASLSPEQTEVAAQIFHYLVTTSGSKIALTAENLADFSGVPESSVQELLQSLSSGRRSILRPVPPPAGVAGPPRYEIFHDVLGAAVIDWRRQYLARRAQAEASHALVAEREKAVAEGEQARAEARATRRRLRQTRLLAAGLAVVLLIAGVLGVYAYLSKREVMKQQALSEVAATLGVSPAESLKMAVKAYRISPDADTREAVLKAASDPRSDVITGFRGESRVAGMVVTLDRRQVVTYDTQGGIGVIDDAGRLTKTVKASHLAGTVIAAATSPSASQVALVTDQGTGAVIDVRTGRQVDLATDRSPISTPWWIESSPDNLVLVLSRSGLVAIYSVTTGREVARLPDPVYWARPTANGQIVTSDHDSRLRIWDARTVQKVAESSPLAGQTTYLQPYEHEAVGVTEDNKLLRWDWRAGPQPRQYPLTLSKTFEKMTMSEDTHTVAIATDKVVRTYNLEDGSLQRTLPKQPNWLVDMSLDPSGQWIATAGGGERVRVWPAQGTGPLSRATFEFIAPGGVARVSYLRDGNAMVILGRDGAVRFCRLPPTRLVNLGDWALGLDVSADGRWLAAASADGTVHIVDLAGASNLPVATVPVGDPVDTVKFDPTDPHRIFTHTWFGEQPMGWRWDSGRRVERISGFEIPPAHSRSLRNFTISRDGRQVAAGNYHGDIYFWDAHTGKLTGDRTLIGSGPVRDIAFDPSGQMIATASLDGIRLTRLSVSEKPKLLPFPGAASVVFDQRGERIVGAAEDGSVLRVWTRDGQLVHDLNTGVGTVGRPEFSNDGRLVAVGTGEGLIKVWDVHSGRMVMRVRGHSDTVNDVLFRPGGQSQLVSASDDSTVVVSTCKACENPDAVIRDAQRWVDGSH